jgi:hypothetical protein
MPDISMCANDNACPVRSRCYRSTASGTKPWERQAYMEFRPDLGERCKGFIRPTLRDSLNILYPTPPEDAP